MNRGSKNLEIFVEKLYTKFVSIEAGFTKLQYLSFYSVRRHVAFGHFLFSYEMLNSIKLNIGLVAKRRSERKIFERLFYLSVSNAMFPRETLHFYIDAFTQRKQLL